MRRAVFLSLGLAAAAGILGLREWQELRRAGALERKVEQLGHRVKEGEEQTRASDRAAAAQAFWSEVMRSSAKADGAVQGPNTPERDVPAMPSDDGIRAGREAKGPTPEQVEAAQITEALVRLGSKFSEERVDSAWASQAEAQIRSAAPNMRLSPECRESLCRVQMAHASENDRVAFVMKFMDPDIWPGERVALRESMADGETRTVLYFGREERPFGLFVGAAAED